MPVQQVIVHDVRLRGTVFRHPGTVVIRSENEALGSILGRIRDAVSRRPATMTASAPVPEPARVLSIMAHGLHGDPGENIWQLELGREGVDRSNVHSFARGLRGLVSDRIRLLSCRAAETEYGRAVCRGLAEGAGVPVFASSGIQDYSRQFRHHNDPITNAVVGDPINSLHGGWINFGQWEGPVYRFSPDGGYALAFEGPAPVSDGRG